MKETLLLLCLIVTVFCQLGIDKDNQKQRRPGVFPSYPKLSNQGSQRRQGNHVFTKLDDRTADPCNEFVSTTQGFRDCQTVPDPQVTVLLPSENSDHPWVPRILQQQANAALTLSGRGFAGYTQANLRLALVNPVFGCGSLTPNTKFVTVTKTDPDATLQFIPAASWIAKDFELIHQPYSLCFSTDNGNTYVYTGFKIQTTWHCSDTTPCSTKQPTNPPKAGGAGYDQLTSEELKIRNARLTCCKAGGSSTIGVGQCIFTSTDGSGAPTSCCGNARVEVATERCCNAANAWVTWLDTPCPCRQVDELGNSPRCPGSELCCFNSKYPEFDAGVGAIGECYNPTTHRCCRSGMRYDPGAQQCCAITGVQSLNVPCPCSTDEHCRGNSIDVTARESTLRCCAQTEPAPFEIQECSIYSNYPEGTGPYQSARCNGKCMDPQYQICCNGVLCAKEYEKCCNSTCCNRFTQTCEPSFRRPAPGNPANPIDFFVRYEVCSTIEQMTPHKALWLFVYPTIWLLTTFLSTGIVLVFANKASSRSYAAIEQAIISVALLLILFSLVLFFSPAFKYTFVILFIELIAILTAASRVLKLNIVCLALHFVLLLYLLDPFHGNQWFTLSYHRMTNGRPDRETAGIMHTIFKMWRNLKSVEEEHWCPDWYLGYGRHDPLLRDTDRFDNPDMFNFAYCNRSYIALLLIFSAIILLLGLVQLMLVLLALLLRFTKPSVKLIVREEYDSGEEVPLY